MAAVMSSFHMHFAATPLRWGHAVAAISKEPRVCKGSQAIQASSRQEYVHIMDLLCLSHQHASSSCQAPSASRASARSTGFLIEVATFLD